MRNLNLKFISVIIFAITFLIGGFFINMGTAFAEDITAPTVSSYTLNGSGQDVVFNPNDPASVSIVINTDEPVKFTRINVLNDVDVVVKYFTEDTNFVTMATKTWNGKNSNGVVMPDGVYTLQVNIKDVAENTNNNLNLTPFTITVDTTAPVITLNGTNPTELTVGDTFTDPATASDNIDGNITANVVKTGTFTNSLVAGTFTIIYNVSDAAGNPATQVTRTVNVNEVVPDTILPVIESHDDVTAEATSSTGAIVNYTAPNVTDNVDATGPAVCEPASGSLFAIGTMEITCNKTDAAGNTATPTTFDVIVQDTTPPEITLNGGAVIDLIVGDSYSDAGATASDNIDGDITANIDVTGLPINTSVPNTFTIHYNVSDVAGNPATQKTRTINVSDTEAPTIDSASDVTAEATGADGATVTYDESVLTATDDIDGVISVDVESCVPASGSTFALGTTPVTCSATDSSGNEGNGVAFSVIVEDTTAPEITLLGSTPVDLTVGDLYSDDGATAFDLVDEDLTGSIVQGGDTVDANTVGTYVITYNVSDAALNSAIEVTRTVNVNAPAPDTTAPVITLNGDNPTELTVGDTFTDPVTASDNIDGDITANIVKTGTFTDSSVAGTFTIIYNVSDAAGNPATEVTRTVNVNEAPPPADLEDNQIAPDSETGEATLSGDTTEVVLTDETLDVTVDITSGTENPTIDVSALVNLVGEEMTGTLPEITINSDVADVVIPDGTEVTGPADWDGVIEAPTEGTPAGGNAPAGFSVGDNVISIGSDAGTLYFDTPVSITLTGVTGTVGYRPAGSDTWQTIDTQCNSAIDPSNISSSECYFHDGGNTIIWTYHFTSFGELDPVSSHGSSGSRPATPAVPANITTPDGCAPGNKFSTTTGRNCNAATPAVGKVLGAEHFNFTKLMKNGSNGNEVMELQKFLNNNNYIVSSIGLGSLGNETIYFRLKTKGAVIKFQIANGLKGDGIVGPLTRAVLNK